MRAVKLICPHCATHLKPKKAPTAGHRILCSHCGRSFAVPPAAEAKAAAPPSAPRQTLWIGVILGGLLLLGGTTISLLLYFATRTAAPEASVVQAEAEAQNEEYESLNNPHLSPPTRNNEILSPPSPPAIPPPKPKAEAVAWLPPKEQEKVNEAIERGVRWLQAQQMNKGAWKHNHLALGTATLKALTLLECGIPADDASIRETANQLRQAVPTLKYTYNLALVVLFFDRLGQQGDEKLIQACALRLVAGQAASGGWTYTCPSLKAEEEKELLELLQQTRPQRTLDLFASDSASAPLEKTIRGETIEAKLLESSSTIPLDAAIYEKRLKKLPPHLRHVASLQPPGKEQKLPSHDRTDNSNTQFAILALSAAHKHDLPLERPLALIVRRFHRSQLPNGQWSYHFFAPPKAHQSGTPAMTGAGLLGLAVGLGLAADHSGARAKSGRYQDAGIEKAFAFLGQNIGESPAPVSFYFLWTVERCGVLFQRREVAGKDWYHWGAELLLKQQRDDGSWLNHAYPGSTPLVDTCFALLFLKRANLAQSLTKKLEFFTEGKALQGP